MIMQKTDSIQVEVFDKIDEEECKSYYFFSSSPRLEMANLLYYSGSSTCGLISMISLIFLENV